MSAPAAPDDGRELRGFYDDRYAGGYMSSHSALEVWRVRQTLADVALRGGDILDYGCGAGAWLGVLADVFPASHVVGADISLTALGTAHRRAPGAALVAFDGSAAPLADGSFDLVFSYHVLEHVHDLDATIADMVRLTRPGGSICACLPCADRGSIAALVARHVEGGEERSSTGERRFFFEDPGHLRSITSADLAARFERHGARLEHASFSRTAAEIEYLARRPHRVAELLGARRPATRRAAVVMAAARWLLAALGKTVALHDARPRRLLAEVRGGSGARRARAAAVIAAWPIGAVIGRGIVDVLPRSEWRRRRRRPGGAGQFVVLRKRGPDGAG